PDRSTHFPAKNARKARFARAPTRYKRGGVAGGLSGREQGEASALVRCFAALTVSRRASSDEIRRSPRLSRPARTPRRAQAHWRRGRSAPRDDRDLRSRAQSRRTRVAVRETERF